MGAFDNDGTVNRELGKGYEFDGTVYSELGKGYEFDGTTYQEVYSAEVTITNLLTNPYLKVSGSPSTSGWSTGDSGIFAGLAADSGLVRIQSAGYSGTNYTWIRQAKSFTSANKYFVKIYGNYTMDWCPFFLDNNSLTELLRMPKPLGYAGAILTGNQFGGSFRWIGRNRYSEYGQVVYPLWGGCTLIDLTATFGAGSEPSPAWCNANIPIFEGSTAIPAP